MFLVFLNGITTWGLWEESEVHFKNVLQLPRCSYVEIIKNNTFSFIMLCHEIIIIIGKNEKQKFKHVDQKWVKKFS